MKIKLTKESRVLLPEGTVVETSDKYAQILLSLRRAEIVTSEAPQLQSDEAPQLQSDEAPQLQSDEAPQLQSDEAPQLQSDEAPQPAKAKRSTTTKKSK